MCGIAGILRFDNELVNVQDLKKITDAIVHRGPDNEGHWISECKHIGFGHRRLSIIDLSEKAHQPMHYLNRYSIVFNGEIYNYLELKSYLKSKKYVFKSKSDTEVLMALYAEKGKEMLKDLDGMFAFAIWDSVKNEMFCAIDRFGEKPFFYYMDKSVFVFASEMKGLWAFGIPKSIKEDKIHNYIQTGDVNSKHKPTDTYFYNINKIDAGCSLNISSKGHFVSSTYWSLDTVSLNSDITIQEASDKYYQLFETSVKNRLRSDVSVGSSLSGGIDSSSIVLMIDQLKINEQNQHVFSARFKNFSKDEGSFINEVKEKSKNIIGHSVWPEENSIIDFMDKVVFHQEEPFGSSSILAQWKVMELANINNVKVLLDGQGADEYLAGYVPEYKTYLTQLFFENRDKYQDEYSMYKSLYKSQASIDHYLKSETFRMKLGRYKKNIFKQQVDYDKLKDRLKNNLYSSGFKDLLRYADRNSMAFSLEIRLPFLYHKLIEFVFSLPNDFLLKNGWSKYIHRKSFENILPKKVCWRKDKIGFEPPQNSWLDNKMIKEIIEHQRNKYKISVDQINIGSYTNSMEWKLFVSSYFQ